MTAGTSPAATSPALSRRRLLTGCALAASGWVAAGAAGGCAAAAGDVTAPDPGRRDGPAATDGVPEGRGWFLPADHLPHARTWMAWPARHDIWGNQLAGVRADVARIARAVARFEPVSVIARPGQARSAERACGPGVRIVPMVNDDLWIRDVGPVFLVDGRGGLAGLDLNFNGWGGKQVHGNDARIAGQVLALLRVPRFAAPFTAEGGALEADGAGTVMATESSIVNRNRNPAKTKARLTAEILHSLGASKLIWVPGVKGHDITDDHIDALARFSGRGLVTVDQPADPSATGVWAVSEHDALRILGGSTSASGSPLSCLISRESATIPAGRDPASFVNVYVNWYVCNGGVLIPRFGDRRADDAARTLVAGLYPGREVVQLEIDNLAAGGGGIHCATQQQPAV